MHARRKQLIILSFVIGASFIAFRAYTKELEELWGPTKYKYRPSYYEATDHVQVSELNSDPNEKGAQVQA